MGTEYAAALVAIHSASTEDRKIIMGHLLALKAEPYAENSFTFETKLSEDDLREHLTGGTIDSPTLVICKLREVGETQG